MFRPFLRSALGSARAASRTSTKATRSVATQARQGAHGGARRAFAVAGAVLIAGTATYALSQRAEADSVPVRVVSLQELSKHASATSLWVAIDGKVYDLTDFLKTHPGGAKILIDNAGKDVTKLYKGIHPPGTLEKYAETAVCIGRLDENALEAANAQTPEEARIEAARAALFGVDSVSSLGDFERYAKDVIPIHAWAYYSTGADSEGALRENADAFARVFFRPRVMRCVGDATPATTVLGVQSSIPVYVSPTARNGLGNPEGEVAVTKGAGEAGILQVLSHYASRSLEEVKAAAKDGQQVGWQVYLKPDRKKSAEEIAEAAAAGAHSIWVTVDTTILGKREAERRIHAELNPTPNGAPLTRQAGAYKWITHEPDMTWGDIAWIKSIVPGLPVVVKGVGAWEDVVLAKKYGADAVVLSNHGGRQLDYAQPPLKTLYDVNQHAPHVLGQRGFSVFLDGGVRHGTDVLKALCLGADAVGLGRPFIYAAAGWGSEGVEKACMLLEEEIEIGMKLLGVTRLDQLGPEYLDTSKL